MERKSFILYQSYEAQINCLSNEEKGMLLSALFEYSRTQTVSEDFPFGAKIIFLGIQAGLDRDHEKYLQACERNKENGKKGGRPKKTHSVFEKPDNDNEDEDEDEDENENENENVNVNVNGDEDEDEDGNGNENENENENENVNVNEDEDGNGNRNGNGNVNVNEDEDRNGNDNELSSAYTPYTAYSPSLPTSALREAPPLTSKERNDLFFKGVPADYIKEREERARKFAKSMRSTPYAVLLEWWEGDKNDTRWTKRPPSHSDASESEKSYDLDEFFNAAVRRSYEEFDKRYPPLKEGELV